jgi:hypothetical protein
MNSNTVLGKIMTLLSLDREEVKLTIARLADGTILESETFDVGEKVEVVSEDGTKTAAPDGEHELELTDESGNKETFKIIVKDGLIAERENVELEEETEEVEAIPATGGTIPDDTELAEEEVEVKVEEDMEDEESDTIDLAEVGKKVEELGYRIAELEKKLEAAEEVEVEEEEMEDHIEEEEIEMQSKKLTGAPVESLFNKQRKENKSTIPNYHSSVLGKMYRN